MHSVVYHGPAGDLVLTDGMGCEGVFDMFCYWLRSYNWNDLSIEGECE